MINKNFCVGQGGPRTTMRLEVEVIDAMREMCIRENVTAADLVGRVADTKPRNLSSALRMWVLGYYRAAATEAGHAAAGHGVVE